MTYLKAAEIGHDQACYNLGLLLDERGQHAQALAMWQQGNDDGNRERTFALGLMAHHPGATANLRAYYPETHI